MSKEVEIIKKAMADNKKVFLKEMKQLNDKLDDLDKRLTKHINFIEKEIKVSVKESRMLELKNWLDYLKAA